MAHSKEEKEPWKLGIKLQFLISWSKQEGILPSLTTEEVCSSFFGFEWWSKMSKDLIHSAGRTVMVLAPWDDLHPLRNAWCIWDMFCTIEGKCKFDVAMSPASMDGFIADVDTDPQNAINDMLATIDTSKSECGRVEDEEKIHDAIQRTIGFKELNEKIFELMRGWMITIYEARIKVARDLGNAKLLSSMNSLATLFMSQGEYEKGLSLYAECLTRRKVLLGDSHPDTLSSMESLANLLLPQEFYEDHQPMSSHIYYVPSLFPSISTIDDGEIYSHSETGVDASNINKERNFKAKSDAINEMPDESWSIGTHFSLFFFPRMEGFPMQKSQCLCTSLHPKPFYHLIIVV